MPLIRKKSNDFDEHSMSPNLLGKENGADSHKVETNLKHATSANSVKISDTDEPELLANNPQKKNWRGIVLALLVIAVISSLIITASILTTPKEHILDLGETFTFDDLMHLNKWLRTLSYKLKGDQLVYLSADHDLVHINLSTMKERILLSHMIINEKLRFTGSFSITPDLTAVLLQYEGKQENRYSQASKYDAVLLSDDRPTGSGKRIEVNPVKGALEQPYLPFVKWSPANDFLAFAYDRHIYIHIYPFDESRSAVLNITRELPDDKIQYGQCDWMYEEEVLQTNVALWWNPSGTKLAFLSFDERNVSVYEIFRFDTEGGLYGTSIRQNYPKAGDPSAYNNPKIGLHMYDLGTGKLMEFPRPSSIPWDGHLVFTQWYNDDILLVCWTDRIQSQAWITVVSWSTGSSWIIFKTSATDGWVDMFKQMSNEPLVHPESQSLFIILPREYTEAGYRGIARLSVDLSGTEIKQQVRWMIAPPFDVTDILYFNGIDEFLFLSPGPDPKNLHVYWGSAGGDIYCLTCDNGNCTYNRAKVSSDGWHFVQECRGPDVPSYFLKTINRTTDISGDQFVSAYHRFTLLDNMVFRQRIYSRAMAKIEFVNLTLREGTRDQLKVDAKLMLPPALNKQHITKYPLLLFTYGGPSKQLVTTKFLLDWSTFLAATAKVIVAVVDGRGTGGRGIRFEHAIYRKLGVVEIEDQLHAIKAMVKTFRFINETQIGAYGWSYGGFTVGHLLAHPENNLVRCGIAVAPVTDFRFYDTAYTERYLGRITDHPDAYMQTSIAKRARNMRSKSLLIAHGSADDNVHLINTVSLTKALIAENVDIDVMIYPDDNHFIPTAANREHLYRKMTTFLMDCYNKTSIRYTMDLTVKDDL